MWISSSQKIPYSLSDSKKARIISRCPKAQDAAEGPVIPWRRSSVSARTGTKVGVMDSDANLAFIRLHLFDPGTERT